ncbi:MAG: NIPSNAP family protein [Pseudomonadota bacterium]
MAFYELRQYPIHAGKMDEWVKYMEEVIIPFQVSKGMVITGSYRGEDDDTVYVWTRRFESEDERKALYAAVYESDFWKNDVAPKVPTMIDRDGIKVTRLVATPKSTSQ